MQHGGFSPSHLIENIRLNNSKDIIAKSYHELYFGIKICFYQTRITEIHPLHVAIYNRPSRTHRLTLTELFSRSHGHLSHRAHSIPVQDDNFHSLSPGQPLRYFIPTIFQHSDLEFFATRPHRTRYFLTGPDNPDLINQPRTARQQQQQQQRSRRRGGHHTGGHHRDGTRVFVWM